MPYPDFLCIGAPKCGTTWLCENLKKHPQISLPYIKELSYFDDRSDGLPDNFIGLLMQRKTAKWKRKMKMHFPRMIRNRNWDQLGWLINYFFKRRDDNWYASLFRPKEGQITGEHTTGYYCVKPEYVNYIHNLIPDCKIIFLLRNPVDQIWSLVKFMNFYIYKKNMVDLTIAQIEKECTSGFIADGADYLKYLHRWESLYAKENIFIGFYDEICECPRVFLLRLFHFLEIDASENHIYPIANKVINKGEEFKFPEDIRLKIAIEQYDNLKRLSDRFGGYAAKWLEEETEFLRKHGFLSSSKIPSSSRSAKYCLTS